MPDPRAALLEAVEKMREALDEVHTLVGTGKCPVNQCEVCAWTRDKVLRAVEKAIRLTRMGGGPETTDAVIRVPALLDSALKQSRTQAARECAQMADEATPTVGGAFHPARLVRDRICREFNLGAVRSDVGAVMERITGTTKFWKADTDLWMREQLKQAREEQQNQDAEAARQLTRVDDRLEAGYECGWNAACEAARRAILRGGEGGR